MLNKRMIEYEGIIENGPKVIEFLAKNSDWFSIIVKIKKPYSQIPPAFNYDHQLSLYVIQYIFQEKDWLVDFLGKPSHQIMVVCRCCKESRKELLKMPNLFLASEYDVPEDICFYRNGKLWFASITHEKISFILNSTKEDLDFLKAHKIIYHNEF